MTDTSRALSPIFSLDVQPQSRGAERIFFQWNAGALCAVRSRPASAPESAAFSTPFEQAAWQLLACAQETISNTQAPTPDSLKWSKRLNAVCDGDGGGSALARAFGEGLLIWREILPLDASNAHASLLAPAREAPDGAVAWGLPQSPAAAAKDIGEQLTEEALFWSHGGSQNTPPGR